MERRRLRVYIAGPISKGDTVENVWHGIRWGKRMLQDGLAPYVPHLDAYMTMAAAQESSGDASLWKPLLEWDIEWVAASEALFRLAGESSGADLEAKVARELDIPVFHEAPHDDRAELVWDGDRFVQRDYDHDWPDYADLLKYAGDRDLLGRRTFAMTMPEGFAIKDSGQRSEFEGGGHRDTEDGKLDYTLAFDGPMFERYARHMTNGAKKYEARNWMKFTDQAALDRAKRSLARHFMQYINGERDEDHAAAIIFNLNVIENIESLMNDLEKA